MHKLELKDEGLTQKGLMIIIEVDRLPSTPFRTKVHRYKQETRNNNLGKTQIFFSNSDNDWWRIGVTTSSGQHVASKSAKMVLVIEDSKLQFVNSQLMSCWIVDAINP